MKDYPSTTKQLSNLTKSAFNLLKEFSRGGTVKVPEEIRQARLQICSTCKYFDVQGGNRCTQCGCLMTFKSRFTTEKCPLNFW